MLAQELLRHRLHSHYKRAVLDKLRGEDLGAGVVDRLAPHHLPREALDPRMVGSRHADEVAGEMHLVRHEHKVDREACMGMHGFISASLVARLPCTTHK